MKGLRVGEENHGRDTVTGRVAESSNPLGTFASFGDVDALVP